MNRKNKYKIFTQVKNSLKKYPLRILKFKRPKWARLQSKIKKNLKYYPKTQYRLNKFNFFEKKFNRYKNLQTIKATFNLRRKKKKISNPFILKNKYKSWYKLKKFYKDKLKLKKCFLATFDNSINLNKLKINDYTKKKFILLYNIKPYFKIDILLWNLNFFKSSYQAKQAINCKKILVNGKSVKSNKYLKKGDILTFDSLNIDLIDNINNSSINEKIFQSFLEIDYYTKTIIIIKDYNSIGYFDNYLIIKELLRIKKIDI